MNAYSFAAIFVIVIGCVIVAHLLIKKGNETIQQPVKSAEDVAKHGIDALHDTAKPVAQGFGGVLNAIAGRIESKRDELNRLRIDGSRLTQENERLKNQRISVDQIQPIFQIAFFQSDLSERDFVKELVKITPGSKFERREEIEYFGIYRAKNTQKFGVDFEALKFRIVSASVIEVGGLGKTKLIGNIDIEIEDEHTELRKHLTEGPLPDVHEILSGDLEKLMINRDRKQRADVHRAITQERRIEQVERGVEALTLQFLKDYFSPRGYTIIKAGNELNDGKSIFAIRDEINGKIEQLFSQNNQLLADAEREQKKVEHDIKEEIQKLKQPPFQS